MPTEQKILNSRQYIPATAAISLVVVAFAVLQMLNVGGEDFSARLNYSMTVISAFIAGLLAVWNWTRISTRDSSRPIWGGLALGLLLWAIAELISAGYPLFFNLETPEISLADVFWLAGYLPIVTALFMRARSLKVRPNAMQFAMAGVAILIMAGLSIYFAIIPVIQGAASSDLFTASINMLYPVADLVILSISVFILFTFSGSNLALIWQVLAAGFILRAFGDLVYNYAIGLDLYWPGRQLNPVSLLSDTPYLASYLILALGVYMQRQVEQARLAGPALSNLPHAHGNSDVLIYTDHLGKLVSVSSNFVRLVQANVDADVLGLSLESALGLPDNPELTLVAEVNRLGYIRARALNIVDRKRQPHSVWLTAAANRQDDEFTGADIVLRATLAEDVPDGETRALAGQIYVRSGELQVENLALVKAYFTARVNLLAGLLVSWGGHSLSRVMEEMFASIAQSHHSRLQFKDSQLIFPEDETQESLLNVMPALLEALTHYAASIAGYEHTRSAISDLEAELEPANLRTLAQLGLLGASLDPHSVSAK